MLLIDLVAVIVFALIGRASHDENPVLGLVHTAWPFVVACLVAWALVTWRRIEPMAGAGFVFVWLVTAWGGLGLRLLSGTSARWPFWIVATVVTGLFLGGWRLVVRLAGRRRAIA